MEVNKEWPESIFGAGQPFFVGCNYWASHAGTRMWQDWREEEVEKDFKALAANGAQVLRVFPLWPDFQPITAHTRWSQVFGEMRHGEEPLPDTEAGRAGVDPVMIERFRRMTELAGKYGHKLIVGIVTGWMSGRMHVPPAFAGINVLTDTMAIKWQVRFVRYFVRSLRNAPAIVAWDLGNECNCMGKLERPEDLWTWSNAISSAVRVEDASRPVVSGMHSLRCEDQGDRAVLLVDQAETTDILCTHPYPCFTPHCKVDPVNTMRNAFHAASETRLYGDVGGVPSFVEEAGNLGPSQSGDRVSARYLENMLWNTWAHDCRGLLWWCGHDQVDLPHTPYDWTGMERELGLLRTDRSPKPTMEAMGKFGRMIANLQLPRFRRDAVCILTQDQDQWGTAYMSFLLAKQAGFDIEYQCWDQPLKEADFYLMPSIKGTRVIPKHRWVKVLAAVEKGATLYMSSNEGTVEPFNRVFGLDIETTALAVEPLRLKSERFDFDLTCKGKFEIKLSTRNAEVLAVDAEGAPALTRCAYGKGTLIFSNFPVEAALMETPRSFMPGAPEHYRIYQAAAEIAGVKRLVTRDNPFITLTEHRENRDSLLVVAVNNTPEAASAKLTPAKGWKLAGAVLGEGPQGGVLTVPGNSGAVLRFTR